MSKLRDRPKFDPKAGVFAISPLPHISTESSGAGDLLRNACPTQVYRNLAIFFPLSSVIKPASYISDAEPLSQRTAYP
jgi:hypothetical protein